MDKILNKTWVITGGAGGIGRGIAQRALKEGAFVCIIDKNKEAGKALLAEYGGERVLFYPGDLQDKETIAAFADKVVARGKAVDVLVNNACYSLGGLPHCTYEQALEVLKVGALAPYELTRLFLPYFSKGANIINISSTRATLSQGHTESYTMAKGAISALTHGMSLSLKGRVRVNAIAPGWIETNPKALHSREDNDQHPVGRVGTVQDIANAAWFLASDQAGFITGQEWVIDGGMTKQMIYHNDEGWLYQGKSKD